MLYRLTRVSQEILLFVIGISLRHFSFNNRSPRAPPCSPTACCEPYDDLPYDLPYKAGSRFDSYGLEIGLGTF